MTTEGSRATAICSATCGTGNSSSMGRRCRGTWGMMQRAPLASASQATACWTKHGQQPAGARWEAEALVLLVVVAGVASHDHGID